MTGRLSGRTALITGASSGIGLEVAKAYHAEGANVVALGLDDGKLDRVAASIGDRVELVAGDVRAYADNERAVQKAVDVFGGLDVFVGNAGIWDWNTRVIDLNADDLEKAYRELFDVNVLGYLLGAKAAAEHLAARSGSIIFSLSTASYYPNGGGALYTSTKHAALGLVRQLAHEFAPRIRVNGVAIGAALTDLRGAASIGLENKSIQELPLKEGAPMFLPMGVQPDVAEFAPPYVMLGSATEASTMTGAVIDALCGYGVRGAMGPNGWSDYSAPQKNQ
ncbi:MAG: SDR family NAD(P)-dependent oxidoreductase [Parvibaculaceae bacterium]